MTYHKMFKHRNVKEFNCKSCTDTPDNMSNFDRHKKEEHRNVKEFNCKSCMDTPDNMSNFDRHKKEKHKGSTSTTGRAKTECDECR